MLRRWTAPFLAIVLCAAPAGAADETVLRVSAPHALVPLITTIAQQYLAAEAVQVNVVERSSNAGSAALKAGELDVAISDSAQNDTGYTDTTVAAVPFAIVVNPATGVEALTAARVKALFEHAATWKDAGGADVPLWTVERPRRSATEVLLEAAFDLAPARPPADGIEDASSSVVSDVRAHRGGIGVVGLPFAGDVTGVTVVKIGGTPLVAYEHAITYGTAPLAASRFIAFLRTQTETWREAGFVPLRDLRR